MFSFGPFSSPFCMHSEPIPWWPSDSLWSALSGCSVCSSAYSDGQRPCRGFLRLNGRLRGVFSDSGSPLLRSLSPLVTNAANLKIDTVKIATTLLILQLLPLIIGLWVHAKRPLLAERLRQPANLISAGLSLLVFTLIIILQYRTLTEVHAKGYFGICLLVLLCLAAGWILGGQPIAVRTAMSMTTAARNVRVALVIATVSFSDTAAVTAVIVFAIFQTLLGLCALFFGRVLPTLRSLLNATEMTV
jgi:predicted Na+-dependent transporter